MKIWYSLFNFGAYTGNEPAFYERNDFEWVKVIENNWSEIKGELDAHLGSNPRFDPQGKVQTVNNHGWWKTMPLMTWGVEFHKNIHNFPVTTAVIKQIPGLVSASFNLLDQQSEINPHVGTTNAFVRVHLGLHIPGNLPDVGFKVKDISRPWQEGKVLIFCDAYEHSGWNHSYEDRYILLLDVIKPTCIHKKKWICANVLATLSLQSLITKSAFIFYLTLIPVALLHFFLTISAMVLVPFYNFIGRSNTNKRYPNL